MDPGYTPVGRQKWQAACSTGLCLFVRLGIVKSSSSGTIQVLILELRYLVIRQEVFDGFNHFNHIKILSKALLMSRRTMAVSFLSFYQWHSCRISSVVWITDVSVECHCLLSLCLDIRRPFASKYDMNCSRVLLARKLLTGLGAVKSVCYCSGFHGRSRSLSMGITSATFCTLLPRRWTALTVGRFSPQMNINSIPLPV